MTNQSKADNTYTQQWIHRQFNSEKIRHTERYRRVIQNQKSICSFSSTSSDHTLVLLPDGLFLRKYLALIEELMHHHQSSFPKLDHMKLVLLESAAEDMDNRNSSPSIIRTNNDTNGKDDSDTVVGNDVDDVDVDDNDKNYFFIGKETPAINERNRIAKLCLEHNHDSAYTGAEVIPFPDLTVRDHPHNHYSTSSEHNNEDDDDDNDDDFDIFGFMDMSIQDRSKCALVRAARFFFRTAKLELMMEGSLPSSSSSSKNKNNNNNNSVEIIILSEDDTSIDNNDGIYNNHPSSNSLTLKSMNCNEFISYLQHSFTIDSTKTVVEEDMIPIVTEHWMKLKERCENEYNTRNQQKSTNDDQSQLLQKDRYGHFEHLQHTNLQKGLNQKKFVKGMLKVTNENCREAYCIVKGAAAAAGSSSIKYYLNGNHGHFNRAIHGDIVVIEPLPKDQWEQPIGRRRLTHTGDEEQRNTIQTDTNNYAAGNKSNVMPTARVVGLYHKGGTLRRQFVATLVPKIKGFQRDNTILVVPMDSKIPRIRIKTRMDHERIVNKRLLVEIDTWNLDSMYPSGHYVKTIGDVGDLNTEINCLLIEHEIDLSPFSANALACLPQIRNEDVFQVSSDEIKSRRDLRTTRRIFSVDPQGCQDIDDAMHAKVLKNGNIEVGVHIADVTQFVKLHSALDKEAAKRGTTFYLVDRRFDMLPALLSSDICSLHGNTDRYAVSVIWTLSPDLEKVESTWYGRTVIHNIQAMTYEQAHNILHDKEPDNPNEKPPPLTAGAPVDRSLVKHLKKDLQILTKLARKLRKRRETIGGAVDLSSGDRGSELKFVLDDEGRPTKVASKKELEIHHTIAELMIMANAFVAETIYNRFPDSSILRIHRTANIESFDELEKLLLASGMTFDGSSNRSLAQTLKDAKANQSSVQDSLFQSLATRAMSEAQYVCTGSLEEGVGLSHYGLGIEMYCHFTSPIRRYADIAVHHLLIASLSQKVIVSGTQTSPIVKNIIQIPKSNAISILSGDNLKKNKKPKADSEEDLVEEQFLDSLIEETTDLVEKPENKDDDVYKTTELTRICENLNSQNRAAKTSSMQCQRLFLSLFFRKNIEVTQAVIVDLRQNGLMVYVPKFDMKGPVFLADQNGCLQMIPKILGLPASSGLPPSMGFSNVDGCRMFPDGNCTLQYPDDIAKARVEVSFPSSTTPLVFKCLDVITIQVSCDLSNTTARIPPPRLHLFSLNKVQKEKKGSKYLPGNVNKHSEKATDLNKTNNNLPISLNGTNTSQSMFQILSSIQLEPNLIDFPMRFKAPKKKVEVVGRVQTLKGRMHYGGFKESNSSSEHLSNDMKTMSLGDQAKLGNYDASRRIEKEATLRIQRKAAAKRNTRMAKKK